MPTTYTNWFDVKDYTSVTVTVQTADLGANPYTSPLTLIWGQGVNDEPPYDANLVNESLTDQLRDAVAQDALPAMDPIAIQTRQYDTRARWLMFKSEKTGGQPDITYSYNFKKAPTQLIIKDNSITNLEQNDTMHITNNSAHLALTDSSGVHIAATYDNIDSSVNALYVHLSDASGTSIDTVETNTLAVNLYDASNIAIESIMTSNNSLKTVISNRIGIEQAATKAVADASTGGRALYYALSDKDGYQYTTTKSTDPVDASNSMFVHLVDTAGENIKASNRFPVRFTTQAVKTVYMFDTVVEASMSSVTGLNDISLQLHSIGIANEFPITVWLKVYDLSAGVVTDTTVFTPYTDNVVYNFPVPPGDYRDIHLSNGVKLSNGIYFRVSQGYQYDNSYQTLGAGSGQIYVTGSYS